MFRRPGRHRVFQWLTGLCAALLAAVIGCPPAPTDNDNGNTNGTGTLADVQGEINNIKTITPVPELDFQSVLYTITGVPDGAIINGFSVPEGEVDAPLNIIATNLAGGEDQIFQFMAADAGIGTFRVGLLVTLGTEQKQILSEGVIEVEGAPKPVFHQPCSTSPIAPVNACAAAPITEVQQGARVEIIFDAGDPEDAAHWRLFYFKPPLSLSVPADELGEELAVGTGNVGVFSFSTADLSPGEYQLGLSATDSGDTIANTVGRGDADLIITIPNASNPTTPIIRVTESTQVTPPTFVFIAPPAAGVELFGDEPYTIRFQATADPSGGPAMIEVFLDRDISTPGFDRTLESGLPITATAVTLPTDLLADTYFVGATVRQGSRPPLTVYSGGAITIVHTPTLIVTAPDSTLPVAPLTPVDVIWTTNVPPSAGVVDVFAKAIVTLEDGSRVPGGVDIEILPPSSTGVTFAQFISPDTGVFQITVRLSLNDGTVKTATAPEFVAISSLPPVLWLGSLREADPAFEGAVFEGVNFQDNTGSSLSPAGDLNRDGLEDYVVGARYGKPYFINPTGIGPGEAYVIYGRGGSEKLLGIRNLNSVGTPLLPGVLLTGIRTIGDSSLTDGLSDITLIPDADGDDSGELVFGFPWADSAGAPVGPCCSAAQFRNGGVIILSSNNSILESPTGGTPVIDLASVGQAFTDLTPVESLITEDRLTYDDDLGICVPGTDGVDDTIVGPNEGFIAFLAEPLPGGFVTVPPGTPPSEGVCVTQIDVDPPCSDALGAMVLGGTAVGSSFYPAESVAQEPLGARILGPSEDSAFGTSVTASNSLGDATRGDLIISAPNRDALAALVDGIPADISGSGVAYLAANRELWGADPGFPGLPPAPFQYAMGLSGFCGQGRAPSHNPLRIAGDANDHIRNILGISDFNADMRNDFAIGAPTTNSGRGRVYVVYRREEAAENDFVLDKLKKSTDDDERLTGALIVSNTIDGLGFSLATDVDFNADGISDLVIGSPNASGGKGEVIIVFGDPTLQTPEDGISIESLLGTLSATNEARAARIRGNSRDPSGNFGFNIANAGDIDGDGSNDLLIAAPGATPRFDPDLTDGVDDLSDEGIDADFDGVMDDVSGPSGRPDGIIDDHDALRNAGLVYVIYGSNRLDQLKTCTDTWAVCKTNDDCAAGVACLTIGFTIGVDQLGTDQLEGFMIAGHLAGDRIGGGDAGDVSKGGTAAKTGRGRSRGLSSAGDVDNDGLDDFLIGSILADPRRDPNTGDGVTNAGEAYLIYGMGTQ